MNKDQKLPGFLTYVRELAEIYVRNHVPRSAAELAYFLMLSVFPTLICVQALTARFLPGISLSLEELNGIFPSDTLQIITDYLWYINTHQSNALLTAGVLGMATSSAAAFRSIHSIMGDIQGVSRFKGLFALIFSFAFSLVFLAAIYFAIIVMVTGDWLINRITGMWPVLSQLAIWNSLRFPLMLVIFTLIIYGLYRITAPSNVRSHFFPGASTAAVAIVLVSALFSSFIGMSTRYPLIYGSLASIIIFMLWLHVCGQILIMGNALNVVLRRHRPEAAEREEAKE